MKLETGSYICFSEQYEVRFKNNRIVWDEKDDQFLITSMVNAFKERRAIEVQPEGTGNTIIYFVEENLAQLFLVMYETLFKALKEASYETVAKWLRNVDPVTSYQGLNEATVRNALSQISELVAQSSQEVGKLKYASIPKTKKPGNKDVEQEKQREAFLAAVPIDKNAITWSFNTTKKQYRVSLEISEKTKVERIIEILDSKHDVDKDVSVRKIVVSFRQQKFLFMFISIYEECQKMTQLNNLLKTKKSAEWESMKTSKRKEFFLLRCSDSRQYRSFVPEEQLDGTSLSIRNSDAVVPTITHRSSSVEVEAAFPFASTLTRNQCLAMQNPDVKKKVDGLKQDNGSSIKYYYQYAGSTTSIIRTLYKADLSPIIEVLDAYVNQLSSSSEMAAVNAHKAASQDLALANSIFSKPMPQVTVVQSGTDTVTIKLTNQQLAAVHNPVLQNDLPKGSSVNGNVIAVSGERESVVVAGIVELEACQRKKEMASAQPVRIDLTEHQCQAIAEGYLKEFYDSEDGKHFTVKGCHEKRVCTFYADRKILQVSEEKHAKDLEQVIAMIITNNLQPRPHP